MSQRPSARRHAQQKARSESEAPMARQAGHPGLREGEAAAQGVRLDKWLWAARFFKTRSQAGEAVEAGRVRIQGDRPKPARLIRLGDTLEVRTPAGIFLLTVRGLADRRGPASLAQAMYQEDPESRLARERLAALQRAEAMIRPWKGRPTKRERRVMLRFHPVE